MDIKSILYINSKVVPLQIELFESSGPVSPQYQYLTHIILHNKNGDVDLSYKDLREYQNGAPLKKIDFTIKLSNEMLENIVSDLLNNNINELNKDFINNKRKKVGISFNYFIFRIGEKINIRFDYLLSDTKKEEFQKFNKVLQIIKDLKKYN